MRHFETFSLDERTGEVFQAGERLKLTGRAVQLLTILTDRPGELVTRDELRRRLWPDDTFVDFDNNLNVALRRLRGALGDSATHPKYIETLPRRGLRFVGVLAGEGPAAPEPVRPAWSRLRQALVMGVVLLVLAGAMFAREVYEPPATLTVEPFRNLSGDPADDYVSEGLRAELTAHLAGLSGRTIDVVAPGINRRGLVVRGTSRRDASGLYVTAELVDTRTHSYLWAGSFSCPRQDLFLIQRQLATKIADRLGSVLDGEP